ncbi:hypothetical protein [Cohnella candidum]|uniref:Uncharacterized protein n=1 Tax=Cohnella candidum TaxID=2674991 RepID=A0A3G3JVW0_9BACL|nr:hypothetical protein [Cohnella candidum]AYQ71639.1 hypothetical protein EAV92_03035 [Cohnella candidum]
MAWDVAAYAVAAAAIAAAVVIGAIAWRLARALRRWDRMALRLAAKTSFALEEYARLAEEARETAAACRDSIAGFSRLAEGARAVGEAAETAAQAAVSAAAFWHDRLTLRHQNGEGDGEASDPEPDVAGIVRRLWQSIRERS